MLNAMSPVPGWVTMRINGRLLSSRPMLKPFSSHLATILFYANYNVKKTQNSAWEPGSSHSACLDYVKKTGSPLLPHCKMHLDDYWRQFIQKSV